jgi:hypothetical protein
VDVHRYNINCFVLFVAVRNYNQISNEYYQNKIMIEIDENLPSQYKPDKIIFFGEKLPINRNGNLQIKI